MTLADTQEHGILLHVCCTPGDRIGPPGPRQHHDVDRGQGPLVLFREALFRRPGTATNLPPGVRPTDDSERWIGHLVEAARRAHGPPSLHRRATVRTWKSSAHHEQPHER